GFRSDRIPKSTLAGWRPGLCPGSIDATRPRFSQWYPHGNSFPNAGRRKPMSSPEPGPPEPPEPAAVLLTGATVYVGGRLLPLLERAGVRLRCLARDPDKL